MALVCKPFGDIITFTRASTATYFDSTGTLTTAATNAPRLDYNPSTLAAQGFLVEEARTNLCLQSEAFNTLANWSTNNSSITANAVNSPAATLTADQITEDSATAYHSVSQSGIAFTSGTAYTFSVFAKANSRSVVQITPGTGAFSAGPYANFNLSTGAVSATGGGASATIQNCGGGWYRCTMTATADATVSAFVFFVMQTSGTAVRLQNYLGDGASNLYIWGAQTEAGAFATSYIPTTTTALTRAADVASVNTLSPWYNSVSGTLFAQGILVGGTAATFPRMTTLAGSNPNNDDMGIVWGANTGSMRWAVRAGGSTQADITFSLPKSAGASFKVAGRYAVNDFQAAFDGNLGTPDTTGSLPTITSLLLGGPASFQPGANVWLQRVTFYPRGLSNAELQAITA